MCVCVNMTEEVAGLPSLCSADRLLGRGCKDHHAGMETYEETPNYVLLECVGVGWGSLHAQTHQVCMTTHLIELLLHLAESLPLSHYDLLVAASHYY